ncbi:hypothetical protein CONCODRAFT_80719 [Conidiobolus coronatus NRRL 28638]|uniref:Uncharacterized protein n=1 Tax=Conidiobolus coronatus (strain ATCC 28846 / CBS 209.66 / NRRL 28638) TaxID=796925 RepID=A0A137NSA6_CONC2|nr:hypothetical protein CONCODRAFT_80719 [Conidiobolus coronatus NRRL 28638]|eukprot:KXN65627.1 hypothetical protein CONCODRAFT_80719 [Conidiobolus coronatus NRRL 28638]
MLSNQSSTVTEYKIDKDKKSGQWVLQSDRGEILYFKPSFSGGTAHFANSEGEQIGKVTLKSFWKSSYTLKLETEKSQLKLLWKMRSCGESYKVVGDTKVPGFEDVNWIIDCSDDNCHLSLKFNQAVINMNINKDCYIAQFNRSAWKSKEIGHLYVNVELPRDIKLFVIMSICFSLSQVKIKETADAIGSINP